MTNLIGLILAPIAALAIIRYVRNMDIESVGIIACVAWFFVCLARVCGTL